MSKDLVRVYECSKCGGLVVPMQKDGRYYEYRGVFVQIPKDVVIPRCTRCGEEWLDVALTQQLSSILEASLLEHSAMIDIIRRMGTKSKNIFPC